MITQLETLIGEPLHFLEAPLFLLAAILGAVAEEVVPRARAVEQTERAAVLPARMRLLEILPDADAGIRVDRQLAVGAFDVAELLGRGVVEHEDDGRHAVGHVAEILVEHLRDRDRTIAALIDIL